MKTFVLRYRIELIVCGGLICGALAYWFRGNFVGFPFLVLTIYCVAKAIRWFVLG